MSLIQSNMSMSEVVEAHTSLIPVINRLGIRLGLKDKSVREVCHEYGLDADFVLIIINTFLNEEYFPEKRLKAFHLSLIVDYLNKTNQYYLRYQIPNVSRHLDLFIQHSTSDNHTLKLIGKFFHNFKERLTSQIQYDEQVWFPYCLSTITEEGNRPCLEIAEGKNRKEDDNTEALLADLKSIMIKHLSGDYNENLCYAVLFAITTLEKDIKQHNRIRERILGQMVQKMEKTNQTNQIIE